MFDSIACIVNYCSQDYRFLDLCLKELKKLFSSILIPVCDHFFNGEKEDAALLKLGYKTHPDVTFIQFAYGDKLYGLSPLLYEESKTIHYWHSTARYVGYHFLPQHIQWVLFLDIDEVIDVNRFTDWMQRAFEKKINAYRFDSFFYFRSPQFRAKTYTQNALLVKRSELHPDLLLLVAERMGTFDRMQDPRLCHIRGCDDRPLFHHYAWVRSEQELFSKVQRWGHHGERNWSEKLLEEFSEPFRGEDLLYGLSYEKTAPLHNPLAIDMVDIQKQAADIFHQPLENFPNVIQTNREALLETHFQVFY